MLIRLKNGKEFDRIVFNSEEKLVNPSDDILAEKEKKSLLKNVAFGIKSQRMNVYTHHTYHCPLFFDIRFFSKELIVEFLSGYYGVSQKDILDFETKGDTVSFQIYENFQRIDAGDRQGSMIYFKTTGEFFKERAEPWCSDIGKMIETEFVLENPLQEAQYQDIFNQLNIARFGPRKITFVKLNEFIKGSVQYPFKLFTRLPYYQEQHLVVQMVSNYFITFVFHLRECRVRCTLVPEDHIITEEEIMSEIWNLKFNWGKILRVYKTHRLQFLYGGSLQSQLKKLQKLQQYEYVKTHGQQYILKGYPTLQNNTDVQRPQLKITFFPNQNNMQIQITAMDDENCALANLTLIINHFQLTQRDGVQFSTIQELQQLDPTEFGADDRYDYEKLVNDVRKRPIYKNLFAKEEIYSKNREEQIKLRDQILNEKILPKIEGKGAKGGAEGGAKGSSVYINFKQYSDKEVDEFKALQKSLGQNVVIKNQTYFQGLFATFQCSPYYPYLNLSQTNGKDAISCVIDPLNLTGVSIFDFYDVARRLLDKEEYLAQIKKLIIGRVSVSATKFTKWVVPGRCAELSVPLQKVFGSGNLMLSLIMVWSEEFNPQAFHTPETVDEVWFKSVFGAGYNELFDGEVYYNADEEKWYAKNRNAKHPAVYIQYNTYNKYLLIKDDILVVDSYHFYMPYQIQSTFRVLQEHFSVERYKDVKIDGYIKLTHNDAYYLVTDKGFLPFNGDISKFKRLHPEEFIPPDLDFITKYCDLKQFDYFFINFEEKIIGGLINGDEVYWKKQSPDKFKGQELRLGSYPICDLKYQRARHSGYLWRHQVVCHLLAKEYYSQYRHEALDLSEENVVAIAKKFHQFAETKNMYSGTMCIDQFTQQQLSKGLKLLKTLLPEPLELQLHFILQQALFTTSSELQYRKEFGEIIRIYKPTSKTTEDL